MTLDIPCSDQGDDHETPEADYHETPDSWLQRLNITWSRDYRGWWSGDSRLLTPEADYHMIRRRRRGRGSHSLLGRRSAQRTTVRGDECGPRGHRPDRPGRGLGRRGGRYSTEGAAACRRCRPAPRRGWSSGCRTWRCPPAGSPPPRPSRKEP